LDQPVRIYYFGDDIARLEIARCSRRKNIAKTL
jgi:hypothetical protein